MIRRNVANQPIYFPQLRLSATGAAVTSGASLIVAIDGAEGASAGTLTHYAGGVWKYVTTQGETNCAMIGLILTATDADTIVLNLITTVADTSAVAFGANTVAPSNSTIALIYALLQLTDADVALIKSVTDQFVFTNPGRVDVLAELDSAASAQLQAIEDGVDANGGYLTSLTAKFSGITVLGDWLRRVFRKDTGTSGMNVAEAEISIVGDGPAVTFLGTTDNLEAIYEASGGGGGDATLVNQVELLAKVDAALASAVSLLTLSQGTLVGFPSTLQIGDAYTISADSAIAVYMRDSNNDPITSVGSHSIDDVDFAPTLVVRAASQIIKATVTLIDPGGGGEKYLRVEFPSSQTIRASQGTAKMQCVLSWGADHRTVATQEVEWLPRL